MQLNKHYLLIIFFAALTQFAFAQENAKSDTVAKYSHATIAEFREQLDDIFNDPNFSSAQWGVVIQSLANGEYFYKRNEDKIFIPASDLKLITSAAALVNLGFDYRFKTEIYRRGKVDGSILKGDLIIKGFGDPTISGRLYDGEMTQIFEDWADSLLELGIDEIDGNIIGDGSAFDNVNLGEGWAWDQESDWFAAPTGALSLNENCVDILIKPSNKGQKATLSVQPPTNYVTLINRVYTVPADSVTDINVYRERGTNIITVTGTVREKSDTLRYYSTINSPTQFFVVVLKDVLQKKGIVVKGFGTDVNDLTDQLDYTKANLLFTHKSVTLSLILNIMNKNSYNFYAEQLLKTLGYEKEKYGSVANGLKVVKNFLSTTGINTEGVSIVDGSGLSRLNLVSPRQFISLLSYMYKHNLFKYFYNSLSVAGRDGTLAERFQKTRVEDNLHAKTGMLEGVRSLSGYIYTGDKEPVAISLVVNNVIVPMKLAENLQDLICVRLANFKRK